MSESRPEGLGLLLLPVGLLFIVLVVAGLFLTAHDSRPEHDVLTPASHSKSLGS
jgi:hypothetical protein